MHGIDVADIGVARVGALHAGRVCDHFPDASGGFFRRRGQFNVVVQALAHFFAAVDTEHLLDFGVLDLRFDEHLGVIAIIEGAHDLTRKF